MIESIVRLSVEKRIGVVIAWTFLVFGFSFVALKLKLDALPDITSNQVQVLTRVPGLTPEEIELRVTRPLEASLGGIPGLEDERALSRFGISSITLVFDDNVEILRSRQLVSERLSPAAKALPPEAGIPELGPITGGLGEIFHFTLSSATRTPSELLDLVEWRVAPILKTVSGVVEVNTWGGARRTQEVRADPASLIARGVSLEDLRGALSKSIGTQAGASLDFGDRHTLLRGTFLPLQSRDLSEVLVKLEGGAGVRVGDVASITQGTLPRLGAATKNGTGETVYVMAQMVLGGNALEVTKAVREKLAQVKEALPRDVAIEVLYDRSEIVNATLRTVGRSLLEGGILVCVVLFLMLGSARAGALVALTIPVAMLGATSAMTFFGVSGNLMSLGAVDFGLLVDGSVVLIEHLFHKNSHKESEGEPFPRRVAEACAKVAKPSFFGVLVILLVYVPIFSLTGVDGKLFRPMAITVVVALVVALVFTLTFLPAAAALFLREKDIPHRTPFLVRVVENTYLWVLSKALVRPFFVTLLLVTSLLLALWTFTRLGTELTPSLDEGSLVIQTTRAADLSMAGAVTQASRMENALKSIAEVRHVVSRIGSPAVATDVMGLEQADVFVEFAPKESWRKGLNRETLLAEIEKQIATHTPGSEPAFTQPIQMRFNELLGGAPYDVVLSVIGSNRDALRSTARDILEKLRKVYGVEDARILAADEISVDEVRPSSLAAAQKGLSVGEVLDFVRGLRIGILVGTTYDGPREVPVLIHLGEQAPSALSLSDLILPAPNKELTTLPQVSEIVHVKTPTVLFRRNGEPRVVLGFNVRGSELGDVVTKASLLVKNEVKLDEGTRLLWGGQYEALKEAQARLLIIIPIVLALITLLLFTHFRQVSPVFWVLSHVPFAAVGGIFALYARGMSLSISAGIGFIALWGVSVMNATVLVTEISLLEKTTISPHQAIFDAALSRVRPVFMTALVAALGFFPMAISRGVGSEIQRPLATVVMGGLLTSTTLTLLVLPTLKTFVVGHKKTKKSKK